MLNVIKCVNTAYLLYLFGCIVFSAVDFSDGLRLKKYEKHINANDFIKCNGQYHCSDGEPSYSNISHQLTSTHRPNKIRRKRAANDYCIEPVPTPDKIISYSCPSDGSNSCSTKGLIRQFTIATIQCTPNYFSAPETNFQSICNGRNWVPPIDRCFKKCEKLNPVNVDLQCYRKGINIACDENLLLAGTRIRPTCKQLYKYGDFVPSYQEIVCLEDGKWDKILFSCVPECGRSYVNGEPLISGGVEERYGDSPWHVAIYNQKKVLICGGTIISPELVLSAAHCFYDRVNNKKQDAVNYEVVVSKVSRNYSQIDNKYQKVFKINEIRYSDKGFVALDNYYAADIVILILQEKITLSPTVLPACVEWIPVQKPPEGTLGKVSGWGANEYGKLSERLLTTNLPFISRGQCLNTVPSDFKPFVTLDKFCAGSQTGSSVLQGDSGGGLLFREGNFYYIRGIVSLKQPTATAIAAFTDLADYVDWILAVRNAIEQGEKDIKDDVILPSTKISLDCGLSSTYIDDSAPWHVSVYNVTENRVTCGGTIISSRLMLSAAHCFNMPLNLSQYEIAVNKIPKTQKTYKIKEVRFFIPGQTAAEYDIAIVILTEKLSFNSEVSPVCIEWTRNSEFTAPEGTLGKFIGWDWNRNGTTTLLTQSLPFISHDLCVSKLSSSHFKSFVQFDKFCADSKAMSYYASSRGSGFVFQNGARYYIRGIMSIRAPAQLGVALFTDISYYINLIVAVLDEVE
ncbi:modular serine protease-like [Planococcus citri]|uniref:modular serine protease-like n=1 Tax=Planococcus citri TaxID=170843 RepID=UPI0031F9DCA3